MFTAMDLEYRGMGFATYDLGDLGHTIFFLNSHLLNKWAGQNDLLGSLQLLDQLVGTRATNVFWAVQRVSASPMLPVSEDWPEAQAPGPRGNWTTFLHERAARMESKSQVVRDLHQPLLISPRRPGSLMEEPFCSGTSLPPMGLFMSFPGL